MKKQHSLKRRLLLLSGVAAIMCTSCIFIPPKEEVETVKTEVGKDENGKDVLKKDGLTCVWQDEFDYIGVPDTSKWKYQTGKSGWGNNEQQNYIDNTSVAKTAIVKDGVLTIKAYKEGNEWKSARMNSKQSWKYGYIEARMKITDRLGAWPAFWMMPQNEKIYGTWPKCGEIDIMENAPAKAGNHRIFSSLHAEGHYAGNPASIGSKKYDSNLSSEWHTVGIKWTENKIACYYDDVFMDEYNNDGSGYQNWPYDQDFYIILNLAIGGNLGGDDYVDDLNGQAEFLIDYVRVYQ